MTIPERETVVRGCLACSIDDRHACSGGVEDDAGGWSTVHCCCGLAVDPKTTAAAYAEYAAYAEELGGLGWSQPAGPGQQPEGSG